MIHIPYTCDGCGINTKHALPVSGHTLCTNCNIKLINNKSIVINSDYGLKITGKRGDFYIIERYTIESHDYFETQKRVQEHAAQCGWDFVIGNPAY